MSKELFFDTETTGFVNRRADYKDSSQPHLVQLGALMLNNAKEEERINVIIRPDGYTIPSQASDVHGITTERAMDEGIPLAEAIEQYSVLAKQADLLVAHNLAFDSVVIRANTYRAGRPSSDIWVDETFCTMLKSSEICKLPTRWGNGYKWPTLSEAYFHFFGKELEGAHDAMVDVLACKDVYLELKKLEVA